MIYSSSPSCSSKLFHLPAKTICLLGIFLLLSCRSSKRATIDSVYTASTENMSAKKAKALRKSILHRAKKHLGAPYGYGSTGPHKFDCSGFTTYVFGKEGVNLPRTSGTQYKQGQEIKQVSKLKPADLVFFNTSGNGVSHVGIVTEAMPKEGNFLFIHASSHGVKVDEYQSSYYKPRYLGARRIIP